MSNCCHNNDNTQFIRKNSQMDIDYNIYGDENTIIHHDCHRSINLYPSHSFSVDSLSEMDHARLNS